MQVFDDFIGNSQKYQMIYTVNVVSIQLME